MFHQEVEDSVQCLIILSTVAVHRIKSSAILSNPLVTASLAVAVDIVQKHGPYVSINKFQTTCTYMRNKIMKALDMSCRYHCMSM